MATRQDLRPVLREHAASQTRGARPYHRHSICLPFVAPACSGSSGSACWQQRASCTYCPWWQTCTGRWAPRWQRCGAEGPRVVPRIAEVDRGVGMRARARVGRRSREASTRAGPGQLGDPERVRATVSKTRKIAILRRREEAKGSPIHCGCGLVENSPTTVGMQTTMQRVGPTVLLGNKNRDWRLLLATSPLTLRKMQPRHCRPLPVATSLPLKATRCTASTPSRALKLPVTLASLRVAACAVSSPRQCVPLPVTSCTSPPCR